MSRLTPEMLAEIADKPVNENMQSVVLGLEEGGETCGLLKPHRLAHYLGQIGHESMGFRYDEEVWGPTPAQKRYDTRTDLGNTPERDGDGKKYAGHTAIQITGKYNTTRFMRWVHERFGFAPNFVEDPDLMLTDPYEGLGPLWYWDSGNPTNQSLNRYADKNNIEMITKRINGGLNGYKDRLDWYTRSALVLLGHGPNDVRAFQKSAGIGVDGIAGPETRGALHGALLRLSPLTLNDEKPRAPGLLDLLAEFFQTIFGARA